MKIIASRELVAKPSAVWKTLKEDGAVVVTKNGQPEGIFYATTSETWLEDVQDMLFARARRAASELRQSSAKSRVAMMTESEIDAEINAARTQRK